MPRAGHSYRFDDLSFLPSGGRLRVARVCRMVGLSALGGDPAVPGTHEGRRRPVPPGGSLTPLGLRG